MNRAQLEERIGVVATVSFSRSGGPGGQNVNKVNTHVVLHVPLDDLGLSGEDTERLRHRLVNRVSSSGQLVIHASTTRSQRRNRDYAIRRAVDMIEEAIRPAPKRRPTRPGTASRERRLRRKRERSQRKRERQAPGREE